MNSMQVEHTNFLRAVYVIYAVAPKAVRNFFVSKHPDNNILTQEMKSKNVELERVKGFQRHMKQAFFPDSGKDVNPDELDITLLIFLLRNFTKIPAPMNGWDREPSFIDSSQGADLLRIWNIRNVLAHNHDGKLTKDNFDKLWKDMEIAIQRLGKGAFNDEIKNIKIATPNELAEKIQLIQETFGEVMATLHQVLRELKDPVQSNIRRDINDELQSWMKEDETFYETAFSRNALQAATLENFVMITGNSGSGKTATMCHIALTLKNKGYDIIPAMSPMEIKQYYLGDEKQVFVVDDALGVYSLDEFRVRQWEELKNYLIRWKIIIEHNFVEKNADKEDSPHPDHAEGNRNKKENSKILISCRSFLTKNDRFPSFLSDVKCINAQSQENCLKVLERKHIFQNLLRENPEKFSLTETLIMQFDSFPLLCRMCAQSKQSPQKFFNFPFKHFLSEIERMYLENKMSYFVLIFCLVFKCRFPENSNANVEGGFKSILDKCTLESGTSHELIRQTIIAMNDTYLCKVGEDEYDFHHTIIRDIIAFHFCSKSGFPILAKYASDSFIRDRVRPKGRLPGDNTEDDFFIILNGKDLNSFIERVSIDLSTKDWLVTFRNPFFPNPELEEQLYTYLKKENMLGQLLKSINKQQNPKVVLDGIHRYNRIIAVLDSLPYKETFYDIFHMREELLRPLSFTFWLIGFGWFTMFKKSYDITETKVKNQIQNSQHATLVLSSFGDNLEMIHFIYKKIVKRNQMCFICNSSALLTQLFVHRCNCKIIHLSGFTIGCIKGNVKVANYFMEAFSFTGNSKFDVSVLENICSPKQGYLQPCLITAIEIACIHGYVDIIEHFLRDETLSTSHVMNGVIRACAKGHCLVVDMLLNNLFSRADLSKIHLTRLIEKLLYTASLEGHVNNVELLLKRDVNVNECDKEKRTPLLAASGRGHLSIVQMLLMKGANIDACDIFGWTPLKVACAKGHIEIVDILLQTSSKSVDELSNDLCTQEDIGKAEKFIERSGIKLLKRFLVSRTSDAIVCVAPGYGISPLFIACCNGYHEVANLLLLRGASVDRWHEIGGEKLTSLMVACFNGYSKVVSVLLSHGASYMYTSKANHYTALICSCTVDDVFVFNAPISVFKETDKFSFEKSNPVAVVKEILSKNSNKTYLEKKDNEGLSALHHACLNNMLEIAKLLLSCDIDVNIRSKGNFTPLWIACQRDYSDIVCLLLSHDAKVNICSVYGISPLWIACMERYNYITHPDLLYYIEIDWSHMKIISSLISHGAEVNAVDIWGRTPLFLASMKGDNELVSFLLEKGASVNRSDVFGTSPIGIAYDFSHYSTVGKLLIKMERR